MFVFLERMVAAPVEDHTATLTRIAQDAMKELPKLRPDFSIESRGLTPKLKVSLAFTAKYRKDFEQAFYNAGGNADQWQEFVEKNDPYKKSERSQVSLRQTMAAVGIGAIKRDQQMATEAEKEMRKAPRRILPTVPDGLREPIKEKQSPLTS